MKKLSIIIPVYNDQQSILSEYDDIKKALSNVNYDYDILFVNDASDDNPEEVFKANQINYISHSENKGYGAAIKTGVKSTDSKYICITDCDGTYPAKEIPRLMEYAEEYPMVVGARDVKINPWLHKTAKRFVRFIVCKLFKREVTDINSGLRIIRREEFIKLMPGLCDRFSLTFSITYAFLLLKLPIKYIPIQYNKRVGESKVRRLSYIRDFSLSLIKMKRFCSRLDLSPKEICRSNSDIGKV